MQSSRSALESLCLTGVRGIATMSLAQMRPFLSAFGLKCPRSAATAREWLQDIVQRSDCGALTGPSTEMSESLPSSRGHAGSSPLRGPSASASHDSDPPLSIVLQNYLAENPPLEEAVLTGAVLDLDTLWATLRERNASSTGGARRRITKTELQLELEAQGIPFAKPWRQSPPASVAVE
jgi:hypothetical protein